MSTVGVEVNFFVFGRVCVRGKEGGIQFLPSSHLIKMGGGKSAYARRKHSFAGVSDGKINLRTKTDKNKNALTANRIASQYESS